MKTGWIIHVVLLLLVSTGANPSQERPYDIIVRDDKEPFMASFQSKNGAYGVMSCGEYGFGAAANAKIETVGCITQITFDFEWRGKEDFSFHPRKKSDDTVTIKAGDNLHGEFVVDSCAKTAKGTIRDDDQNLVLMTLIDTDITDSKDYCGGPPDYK
ncbi:MAG TPA: hypothetical protein VJS64_06500 [Pyrinomonadaceae bacterium]|nr:hypothetical protein [Pyrinomonadaceae bacterium]